MTLHAPCTILDLYVYSAELKAFDGVGSFHKVSQSLTNAGITEAFLLELGVRKSIAIEFLFQVRKEDSCYRCYVAVVNLLYWLPLPPPNS